MTASGEAPLRKTPLHDIHAAAGGRMVAFAGYEMPIQYASILDEHRTVREAVGLFDLSHMGEVEIRGEEAVAFLRYALVSDPGALVPGAAQYSMLCQDDGGIIDDLIVYRFDDERFWIVCNASNRDAVIAQLSALVERGDFGVTVEDCSDRTALVAPQGPRAAELLAGLTDVALDTASVTDDRMRAAPPRCSRGRVPCRAHRLHRRGWLRALLRRDPGGRAVDGHRVGRSAARPAAVRARRTRHVAAGGRHAAVRQRAEPRH